MARHQTMVTYDGRTMSIKDHARRLKIPYSRLRSRIARHGATAAAFASPARKRGTPEEIKARRDALFAIAEDQQPMTARAVFYQAEVKGVVGKDHSGYKMVVADLKILRRSGQMPYEWIVDTTRSENRYLTHDSPAEALDYAARAYRKSLWTDADCDVQIWLEKAALEGVIEGVTHEYDVPLMVARGYGSLSFLHRAAMDLSAEKPTFIYYLGDHDPSGENAGEVTEERLRELAADPDLIHFKRIAVTSAQIDKWNLPTRPTKTTDSRAAAFVDEDGEQRPSVELDAIEPRRLRAMVKACILHHQPQKVFDKIERQQERERAEIVELIR
jgi:transposase